VSSPLSGLKDILQLNFNKHGCTIRYVPNLKSSSPTKTTFLLFPTGSFSYSVRVTVPLFT
jgi:hypothetical protein